jgi:hypothetical protein
VIAPCLLIHWDDQGPDALTDAALKVRPAYTPDWWHYSVRERVDVSRSEPPPPPPPEKLKRTKPASDKQLGLPGLPSAAPVEPQTVALPSGPLAVFAGSEMLKARAPKKELRDQVVQAVEFLLDRHGAAPDAVFAEHMGEIAFRIGGLISKLQEVLNVDGYAVLRFDTRNRQVFLDREKLEQQFEVKL